jgi:2-hydroxyacyl-CoA lyase 1
MEVETMARMGIDILIFVVNNGGIYFGDSNSREYWKKKQDRTKEMRLASEAGCWVGRYSMRSL